MPLSPKESERTEALIEQLGHSDPAQRQEAIDTLKHMGPAVIQRLKAHRDHRDPAVRDEVNTLLEDIGPLRVIHFWTYAARDDDAYWAEVKRTFESENPGVVVRMVTNLPGRNLQQKMNLSFIDRDPPDVLVLNDWWTPPLNQEGVLLPLEPFIESDSSYRTDDYPTSMVNVGYVGKVRYSVPYYGGYTCLLYRTDHFRQAGVSPPETWQELITVCHTLQRELGMDYPLGISPGAPFPIGTWIWQNDGRILSRDYREVMLDDPEAIGAVRFVHSLVHDHKVVHPDLAKDLSPMKLWGDGKVAMVNFGAWNFNLLSEKYPQWEGKWDIAPLPRGEQYASFYGGQHLMIPKGARHPELAWKFIVLLTRQDMQALMARELGRPPANLRCFEDPEFQRRHPFMTKMKPWMVRGRNYPFAPFFWEIWNEQFTNEVLDVIMTDPDANIERVMKHATIQMQKTADGYWRRHGYFYAGKQITSDNHTSH